MKLSPLLLAGSLAANLAFAALIFVRPTTIAFSPGSTAGKPATTTPAKSAPASRSAPTPSHSATASSPAAAELSGPEADARDLALGRTLSQLVARARAGRTADVPWWKPGANTRNREADLRSQRELSDAITAAFGSDPLFKPYTEASLYSFLPPDKRDALRRIVQDYDEMLAQFGANGIELASDREKQKLLRAERDRDIAALLSSEERAAYEMRTSPTGTQLKARFGDAIASEDEFAKLYALQKAFDDRFTLTGTVTQETLRARADAERQLQADIASALGSDRHAALKRATDPELRTLDALATRLGLSSATADGIVAARDTYGLESQRINSDTTLSAQDRRQQLIDLGTRAKAELTATLGAEGAEAYLRSATWMSMLQSGIAYSNTPPNGALSLSNGPSVFPVPPRPAAGGTANNVAIVGARQAINLSSYGPTVTTADSFVIGGSSGGPAPVLNQTQVMTFTTAVAADAAIPFAPTTDATVIKVQPGPPPAPPSAAGAAPKR